MHYTIPALIKSWEQSQNLIARKNNIMVHQWVCIWKG
jgi:hypothetical protein